MVAVVLIVLLLVMAVVLVTASVRSARTQQADRIQSLLEQRRIQRAQFAAEQRLQGLTQSALQAWLDATRDGRRD